MSEKDSVEIHVLSDPCNLCVVRAAVSAAADRFGLDEPARDKVVLAVDEAMTNVIRHGYKQRTDGAIDVTLSRVRDNGRSGIQVVIEDEVGPVDVERIARRSLDEVRPGGLGVNIIYESFDQVEYSPRPDAVGLKLTLRKYQPVPRAKESADRQ
ncbi:MAG: ATP-binding protein [Phycisphaeraceae bacterium]